MANIENISNLYYHENTKALMYHVTYNHYIHTAQYISHTIAQGVTQGENLRNIYIQIHTVVTYTLHNTKNVF